MIRVLAVTVLLSFAVLPVAGQDDAGERWAAAGRLVATTSTDATVEAMIEAVWPPVRKAILAQNPGTSDEELGAMRSVLAGTTRELVLQLSDDVVAFYASEFTLKELEDLEAFYAGPLGGKLLAVTPRLVNQAMPQMLGKLQAMEPRLLEEMRKAAKEHGLKLDV